MDIINIIAPNLITLCLIVGVGMLAITNSTFDKRSNRYFIIFILISLMLDIADMADFYLASLTSPSIWRYVTSAIGYTLRPASIAILINILLRRKKTSIAIWTPVFAVAVIASTSYFTHMMFWFDSANQFCRGPLGYLSHIVSAIYLIFLIATTLRVHRYLDVGEMITIFYITAICVLATALESLFYIKFLLPGVMICSCALYYIVLYVQSYKIDILTGALNRRSLFADLEKLNRQNFAVISIDLNGLKDINDRNGHRAGDIALCTLVNTIISFLGKDYRLYRIGGDEFVVIGKAQTADDAQGFIDKARLALRKTEYMASFGVAVHLANDNIDNILNQADSKMYEDKQHYKHRTSIPENISHQNAANFT